MPTYASPANVRTALGKLGGALPDTVNVDEWLELAHADVLERLGDTYGPTLPTFTTDGLVVLRWAEAKLAAAGILSVLRASLADDSSAAAESLTASAYAALNGGVTGSPAPAPGSGGGGVPGSPSGGGPRVSNRHTSSLVADPYAHLTPTPAVVAPAGPSLDGDVLVFPGTIPPDGYIVIP